LIYDSGVLSGHEISWALQNKSREAVTCGIN
jgi:hypothetical protein